MMEANQSDYSNRLIYVENYFGNELAPIKDRAKRNKLPYIPHEKLGCKACQVSTITNDLNLYLNQHYPLLILDGGLPAVRSFGLVHYKHSYRKTTRTSAIQSLLIRMFSYEKIKLDNGLVYFTNLVIKLFK